MKKSIRIGDKEYKSKKDAIAYYKALLNSYAFGESLNDADYNDIIDLLSYADLNSSFTGEETGQDESEADISNEADEDKDLIIEDIKVSRVQYNTKCFEVFYNDETSQYISYLQMVNSKSFTSAQLFNIACRNTIQTQLRDVKQEYFDKYSVKGLVKCQETNQLSKWTELAIDHRQPNTLSVIVDRFKELNKVDVELVEYSTDNNNLLIFKDENLSLKFANYHKEKANLRIVRKECNSSRTGLARLKRSTKDLKIK